MPLAVQVLPLQQDCPMPPQEPQLPAAQVLLIMGQEVPLPVQLLPTQQPPEAQALAAQQGWPGPPQAEQVPWPGPVHTMLALQARPAQQGSPVPPQA
jgi:hypothetical protein